MATRSDSAIIFRQKQVNPIHVEALFISPVFSPQKDLGIRGDLVFTQYFQIRSNTLPQK
jgi:hypothetical protein